MVLFPALRAALGPAYHTEYAVYPSVAEGAILTQQVRRSGNSLIVTIPCEEAERLGIQEGDLVAFESRRADGPEAAAGLKWYRPK